MSLVTCCPACGTMFKVVPDQLKISEGWVRCGHCAEVFDATAHMMGDGPPAATPPPTSPPTPVPTSVPLEADTLPPGEAEAYVPNIRVQPSAQAQDAGPMPMPMPMPVRASESAPDSESPDSSLDQPFVFRRSDLTAGDSLPPLSPPVADSRPAQDAPSSLGLDDEHIDDVSFMRQARRDAFWRRPAVRALLVLLILALGAALALQYAVHDRDRLAAAQPELRPWIEQLCGAVGCRVEAPRRIETLAIDSSSFNKLRSDAYRLNFTLKNNADTPVATPAMELTLTDGQDQPVLRRVLMPSDIGTPPATIASGGEWVASVALTVNANGQAARIAGYRLLAFYP